MAKHTVLKGHTALVTGGAVRIGRAITRALADTGVNVAIHYYGHDDEAQALHEEILAAGVDSCLFKADLSDPAAAEGVLDEAWSRFGTVDYLVNNAGVYPASTLKNVTLDDITSVFAINTYAPLVLARAFAGRCGSGSIVNIIDNRILHHNMGHAAYHLSKRSLHVLTEMMAIEFAPNIRVNGVAPGLILPPPGEDETYLDRLRHLTLLDRHGSAEDIAEAVLFLLAADFITGQTIIVDGGQVLKRS